MSAVDAHARRWLAVAARAPSNVQFHGDAEAAAGAVEVPVLIEVGDPAWRAPPGVVTSSRVGAVIAARATAAGLASLDADPRVLRVECSRGAGLTETARSAPDEAGTPVEVPSLGDGGGRALVAIVDTGIDALHPCFLDGSGTSRILGIWDQTDRHGGGPHAIDPRYPQRYGAFHDRAAIARAVASGLPPGALERDPEGHGTHVASIAAGRATGGFAGGVAPDAPILVVIPALHSHPEDPRSVGYSHSHVDALAFIDRFAELHDLPVVVNVSLGMNAGAHDGSSLLEAAFDGFTDGGRRPGRAIVKSAGNERGQGGHAQLTVTRGLQAIEWIARPVERWYAWQDYFEAWFDAGLAVQVTLVDPSGARSPAVSLANPTVPANLSGRTCTLELTRFHRDNGDSRLRIEIDHADTAPVREERWRLEVVGVQLAADRDLHMWVERDDARAVRFVETNGELTLSIPGTARSVITVGACSADEPIALVDSSSHGPTRDRRRKPDLVAPGQAILGALAGGGVIAWTGTSMAAPHVAGAIAIALSRQRRRGRPLSNAAQLRAALAASATGVDGAFHPGFGAGRLDARRFIELLA